MKLVYHKLLLAGDELYACQDFVCPHFDSPWHFHSDYEIVLITKGTGMRYVGRSIEPFAHGDLIMIGPNLPHVWINGKEYYEQETPDAAGCVVIQFRRDILSDRLLEQPEFAGIAKLLTRSLSGLHFVGPAAREGSHIISRMLDSKGVDRYSRLIGLLDFLSRAKEGGILLNKTSEEQPFVRTRRMEAVYTFLENNYNAQPQLEHLAQLVSMDKSALCRYIKQQTGKTFTSLLNEVRISYASKLLRNAHLSIAQVGYESGFNNLSHFNEWFRRLMGKTPGAYRKSL